LGVGAFVVRVLSLFFFFFKHKTAYEVETGLEFRRVLFRSLALLTVGHAQCRWPLLKSPSGVRSPGKFSGPLEAKIKYGVYTLRGGKPVGLPPRSFSMRYGLDCGILIDHWSVLAAVF